MTRATQKRLADYLKDAARRIEAISVQNAYETELRNQGGNAYLANCTHLQAQIDLQNVLLLVNGAIEMSEPPA